jgi:hypothetical protein
MLLRFAQIAFEDMLDFWQVRATRPSRAKRGVLGPLRASKGACKNFLEVRANRPWGIIEFLDSGGPN